MDTKNASVDRRSRIELLDLRDQREGQCHIFFKSTIVRAEMFYANPTPVKSMRITHFLKVGTPPDAELIDLDNRLKMFKKILLQGQMTEPDLVPNEDISIITDTLNNDPTEMNPVERGVTSLVA